MANWEDSRYPPRASSRLAPGIFVNVEFGVSFSRSDRPHTTSINYTSRNMQERLYRQQHDAHYRDHHPAVLMPRNDYELHRQTRDYQQERQRRLGVRPLEQHERGSSAPPTVSDRDEPVSPIVSPLSPEQHHQSTSGYRPVQHTSSLPLERMERPLPYSPARFRLGEDELPWSVPPWYRPPEPEFASPTLPRTSPSRETPPRAVMAQAVSSIGPEVETRRVVTGRTSDRRRETRRIEDPQRVRDLGQLHQAMMTVDSLGHDGWETWTWEDSVGDLPRGPRSLGWAVSTEPSPADRDSPDTLMPPPPYVVSQWEQVMGRVAIRPRSSG